MRGLRRVAALRTRAPLRFGDRLAATVRQTASALLPPLILVLPDPAQAQQRSATVSLDAGAIHSLPPAGAPGESSSYLLLGGRMFAPAFGAGSVRGELYGGLSLEPDVGDWVSAALGTDMRTPVAGGLAVGLGVSGSAFYVGGPNAYRAATLELRPELEAAIGTTTLELWGFGGAGRSRVETPVAGGGASGGDVIDTEPVSAELWAVGGGAALQRPFGVWAGRAGAEAFTAAAGDFGSVFIGAYGGIGSATWGAEVRWWGTPSGGEAAVTATVGIPLGDGWDASVSGGHYGPQPLMDIPPATSGAAIFTWRALTLDGAAAEPGTRALYDVLPGADAEGQRRVRFALDAGDADSVVLVGEFTGWRGVSLSRSDDGTWEGEMSVAPGVYRFGFRVDGAWRVPEDARGRTEDEWGRPTAMLLVPAP